MAESTGMPVAVAAVRITPENAAYCYACPKPVGQRRIDLRGELSFRIRVGGEVQYLCYGHARQLHAALGRELE